MDQSSPVLKAKEVVSDMISLLDGSRKTMDRDLYWSDAVRLTTELVEMPCYARMIQVGKGGGDNQWRQLVEAAFGLLTNPPKGN